VQLVEELTSMMLAQRGFELNGRVVQAADQMMPSPTVSQDLKHVAPPLSCCSRLSHRSQRLSQPARKPGGALPSVNPWEDQAVHEDMPATSEAKVVLLGPRSA